MNIPRVLNNRYEIGELLGRGGMADVYKAQDLRLGRTVAIKLLRADVARDSQLQARFRREAQAVAGLNHPSIVAVYDTGEHIMDEQVRDSAHLPYIVMECVHGKTLRELIRNKDITTDQAIDYTSGILSALDYSHRAGIVHRDIKPANVMITQDEHGLLGQVKVMDFGIARTISDAAATMTQTQTVMGTAQYLSPEQALGESVDARSDLYSAACLLFEMLAGRPPFTGDSPVSVAYQHVREQPPVPSNFNHEISPALDALLMQALEKDRGRRFQNASSFRNALRAARTGIVPIPVSPAATQLAAAVPLMALPDAATPSPAETDDGGPSTRAMAKVLAGGPLTTDEAEPENLGEVAPSQKRRRTAWMVSMFVVLALVLGAGGFFGYNWINNKPPAVQQVSVPTLTGVALDTAMLQLEDLGMVPKSTEEFSTEPAGVVIRTFPQANARVNLGADIEVFVSKGPSEVMIPKEIAGRTEPEIRANLIALGLTVKDNDMVQSGEIAAALVVTSDPAPGETVPVGTAVTLKISTGQIAMPSLFDLSDDPAGVAAAVTAALHKVSPFLSVTFDEAENSVVTPGLVTGQSIPAGTVVAQNSTVVVTLAKAPATPEPPPTTEAVETPTAKPRTPDKPTQPPGQE
ncbi:Stk1 family PASTA domain-containing Ser/Thr kinase [Arthrobacter psychrolactophilus]|uniref:non-specific serine/threonine protein kinase n=1 Tax=Arthrobacter psychrolactophilus TaxID=92442 RepID=A0A2V5IKT3_9MICC|nr:Stk1 family PASTA domain-containing Ser/Thr kinase [Arthrobacter psychrolactophilus]PYI37225.1 Stk1 family PASTA domain-containing Ser/Thr kinase [Arthrobacter psychrolactophilus]